MHLDGPTSWRKMGLPQTVNEAQNLSEQGSGDSDFGLVQLLPEIGQHLVQDLLERIDDVQKFTKAKFPLWRL
ncbi:MAG: hypothetical protein O6757_07550, partial [Alphaproteobacteria bacterium]|nr:hypothetical protein [Alphaproteobacteria bacterium]